MINREEMVAAIAQEVVVRLQLHLAGKAQTRPSTEPPALRAATGDGVLSTVDEAVRAAAAVQPKVAAMSLEDRGRMITIIRRICCEQAEELGRMELEETRIGRLDH